MVRVAGDYADGVWELRRQRVCSFGRRWLIQSWEFAHGESSLYRVMKTMRVDWNHKGTTGREAKYRILGLNNVLSWNSALFSLQVDTSSFESFLPLTSTTARLNAFGLSWLAQGALVDQGRVTSETLNYIVARGVVCTCGPAEANSRIRKRHYVPLFLECIVLFFFNWMLTLHHKIQCYWAF